MRCGCPGAEVDPQIAPAAHGQRAPVRSGNRDFPVNGLVEGPPRSEAGRIHAAARDGGHALRDAREPVRCAPGRRRVYRRKETGAGETGGPDARVPPEQGYLSNVPPEDSVWPTTSFAKKHSGEDLPADHGSQLRLMIPHLQ